MKHGSIIAAVFPLLFFIGCAALWPFGGEDEMVAVRGTQFVRNGKPYLFAGTNLWYAPYLGSPGAGGDRARLRRELDSLQAAGVTNLRILAGSERGGMNGTLSPSFITGPDAYNDSLLLGLDMALAELAERGMTAVLFFTNYWEWSGGMLQYVTWADALPVFDPSVEGWDAFMDRSASFYGNENANRMYRSYIRTIIARVNTVNGRRYAEDPSIMAWQLANEPRPGSTGPEGWRNAERYVRWIDETAAYIKSLDSLHLVSTGSEGIVGSLQDESLYVAAHRSRHIDYLTLHLWPGIWRWFDAGRPAETFGPALDSAGSYVRAHLRIARQLQKPLVLEEFGWHRDEGANAPSAPASLRDRFYERMLDLAADSAEAGSPMAGTNFWAWGGEGRSVRGDGRWRAGDPLTGDPPHEPQGMHSVFDTDMSTVNILKAHAARMRSAAERRRSVAAGDVR